MEILGGGQVCVDRKMKIRIKRTELIYYFVNLQLTQFDSLENHRWNYVTDAAKDQFYFISENSRNVGRRNECKRNSKYCHATVYKSCYDGYTFIAEKSFAFPISGTNLPSWLCTAHLTGCTNHYGIHSYHSLSANVDTVVNNCQITSNFISG